MLIFCLCHSARPYFLFPLLDQHLDVGSQLTWVCDAVAIPRATYAWYRDSQLLTSGSDIQVRWGVCTCTCTSFMCVHVHLYIYVCVELCTLEGGRDDVVVWLHICMHWVCVCVCVNVWVCVHTCVCVCV